MRAEYASHPHSPIVRISCLIGEAVCAGSAIRFTFTGEYDKVLLSMAIALLVALPLWVTRFFILPADWLTVFVHLYVLGVLLGHNYDFYDRIPIWDKLLHTAGGVMFAIIGQYLLYFLNGKHPASKALTVVFMIAFSIAAAAVWEFLEFGDDLLFGNDTQRDTYITSPQFIPVCSSIPMGKSVQLNRLKASSSTEFRFRATSISDCMIPWAICLLKR